MVETIPVGDGPYQMECNPSNEDIYVANLGSSLDDVTVIDTSLPVFLEPIADAGRDQFGKSDELVQLDGSNSSDPNESYSWIQTNGPEVMLNDATAINQIFSAPHLLLK